MARRKSTLQLPAQQYSLPILIAVMAILALGGLYLIFRSHAFSADINGDGVVDIKDLSIIAGHFGQTGVSFAQGDVNGDGRVDISDLSLLAASWGGQCVQGCAKVPDTVIENGAVMANAKANISQPKNQAAVTVLTKSADSYLNAKLLSVMDKPEVPASGDKHDFMSVAVYWWPNPNTPDGLPYVPRDGKINPEFYTITDLAEFGTLVRDVNVLSNTYYFTGQTKYSDKAALMIRTWFIDSATKMNPNMQYAGAIKGITDGSPIGVMQLNNLPQILDDIQILKTSGSWTASDQTGFETWCGSYFNWVTTSVNGVKESAQPGNLGSWYNADAGALAEFLGNHTYAQQAVTKEKGLIDGQIRGSDGFQPLEMARTRPWNYSNINLQALATMSRVATKENIDLWDYTAPHGGSIKKAINFLVPYVNGTTSWPYPDYDAPIPLNHMTFTLRQAATAYNNPMYSQDADMGLGTALSSDYTSLLY